MPKALVDILISLTQNSSYLTLMLGTFLAIIASLKTLPMGNSREIVLIGFGRVILFLIAVLLILTALWKLFYAKPTVMKEKQDWELDYGLKITTYQISRAPLPKNQFNIEIQGTFKTKPPDNSAWTFHRVSGFKQDYPQEPIRIIDEQHWESSVVVGGNPQQATIVVATLGKSGRALCQYYKEVVLKTGKYIAIDQLEDTEAKICEEKAIVFN